MKTQIKEALLELLSPKKAKKSTPKYVLCINGTVISNRISGKKELTKTLKSLACSSAEVLVYKLEGEVTFDIPVTIGTSEEETRGE